MTGVDSERFLIEDWGDRAEVGFGTYDVSLELQLRVTHVVPRTVVITENVVGHHKHVHSQPSPLLAQARRKRYTLGQTADLLCPERMDWCVAWSIVQQYRWFRGVRGGVRRNQVVLPDSNDGRRPIILTPKLRTVTQH